MPQTLASLGDALPTDRAAANGLAVAALLAPGLGVFAPLALAPLLAILALALIAIERGTALAGPRKLLPLASLLALVSVWAAITALWSTVPGHSLFEAGRLLLISLAGLVVIGRAAALDLAGTARMGRALLIGLALALVLLQVELRSGGILTHLLNGGVIPLPVPTARYDRGIVLLLLFSWGAGAVPGFPFGRYGVAAGILVVGSTILDFQSAATVLAGLAGLIALLIAWRLPRLAAIGLLGIMAGFAFILPLTAPGPRLVATVQRSLPELKPSAIHRLVIWRFVSDRIAERPLFGWGMDASRAIPGGDVPASDYMPTVVLPATAQALPLHPHDAALQWRLELGALGALLCLAIVGSILWRLVTSRALSPGRRALALGYATSVIVIALLSYGAWQAWWLSSLWLTAALLAALLNRQDGAAA